MHQCLYTPPVTVLEVGCTFIAQLEKHQIPLGIDYDFRREQVYLIAEEVSGMRAIKRLSVNTVITQNGTLSLSVDGLLILMSAFCGSIDRSYSVMT